MVTYLISNFIVPHSQSFEKEEVKMTCLLNKNLSFELVEKERVFALLSVSPIYEYDTNNQRTDRIVAWRYTVANTESFEKYSIKVTSANPIIAPELLKAKRDFGEKFFVEFENATIKMYRSGNGTFEDSIKADSVDFVEDN